MALSFPSTPATNDIYTSGSHSWVWDGISWNSSTAGGAGGVSDRFGPLTSAEVPITGATTGTVGRAHVCSGTTVNYTVGLPAASDGEWIGFRMASGLTKLVTVGTQVMWANESIEFIRAGGAWVVWNSNPVPMFVTMNRTTDSAAFNNNTWTAIIFTAKTDGTDFMWDSVNGRAVAVRDSTYQLNTFTYVATLTGSMTFAYHGPGVNGAGSVLNYAQSSSVSQTSVGQSIAITPGIVGDWFVASAYQDATTAKFVGAANPSMTVMEIPKW